MSSPSEYRFEADLVDSFICAIRRFRRWTNSAVAREFNYSYGRPDVLILEPDRELVCVEAKLSKWRGALQQGYRNTAFATRSYVLLPEALAVRVAEYSRDFLIRQVGLCTLVAGEIEVLLEAPVVAPIQLGLAYEARQHVLTKQIDVAYDLRTDSRRDLLTA